MEVDAVVLGRMLHLPVKLEWNKFRMRRRRERFGKEGP